MKSQVNPSPYAGLTAVVAEYLSTLVHHVYGGVAFGTPERLVMAAVFTGVMALTLGLQALAAASSWARWGVHGLVAVFWVALLGGFEGGYNHVYATVRYLLGAPLAGYHADLFFQATGVLTFVFGVAAASAYLRAGRPAPLQRVPK